MKTISVILFVTLMAFSMTMITGKVYAADSGCGGPCIYGPAVPGGFKPILNQTSIPIPAKQLFIANNSYAQSCNNSYTTPGFGYSCSHGNGSGLVSSSPAAAQSQPQIIDRNKDIQMAIQDPNNNVPGKAALIIYSDSDWSGSIMDTSYGSSTIDGSGDKRIEFQCTSGGTYSLAFQKQNAEGYLFANVVQDGKLLNVKTTTAEYGMVTMAGNCD